MNKLESDRKLKIYCPNLPLNRLSIGENANLCILVWDVKALSSMINNWFIKKKAKTKTAIFIISETRLDLSTLKNLQNIQYRFQLTKCIHMGL